MKTLQSSEKDVSIRLSEDVLERAKNVARKMSKEANSRSSFQFFEGSAESAGIISNSSANMIVLGSFNIENMTYFVGIPTT